MYALVAETAPLAFLVFDTRVAQPGRLPDGWHIKVTRGSPDVSVTSDGQGSVLHLKSRNSSFGVEKSVDLDPATPVLWVLRDILELTGTKYGCGVALCGACTVLVNGQATRTCVLPVSAIQGKQITTIEGLSPDGSHPLQKAWIAHDVPQCGYCQSGMLMAAAALLRAKPRPTDADIDAAITNICRCGTYARIRQAIHTAAKT